MRHVDELINFPEYLEKIKYKISVLTLRNDTDCWNWLGMLDKRDNRAYMKVGSRRWPVARILMLVKHGAVGSLQACHECDNPQCVNPDHIWLGTCKDNQKDKWNKGRAVQKLGEDSPKAKLKQKDVEDIRREFGTGTNTVELAHRYNISVSTVYSIVGRKRWKHVP